jgi:hypothetical protein
MMKILKKITLKHVKISMSFCILIQIFSGVYFSYKFHPLTNGLPIFDLNFSGYNLEYAQKLLVTLGKQGRDFYIYRWIPFDLFFMATYFTAYSIFLAYFLKEHLVKYLIFLPLIVVTADLFESVNTFKMLYYYPSLEVIHVQFASISTILKTILYILTILVMVHAYLTRNKINQ